MIQMRPQIESRELQGPADVGLPMQIAGDFSISATSPTDPQKRLQFVAFDAGAQAFRLHVYAGEKALIFRGDFLFEPDISKRIPEGSPGPKAGTDIFFDGKDLYIVALQAGGNDWRLVSLASGNVVTWNNQLMHVFPSYTLSVRSADGDSTWMFHV